MHMNRIEKKSGYPGTLRWGYLRVIGVGYKVLPERHLVAKPNGGFWVDSIFLHYITSTLCVEGHTKISVSKVIYFKGNV